MSMSKVEVRTGLGMLLTLPLDDYTNGYVVEEILGLDPVKATIASSTFATLDGGILQNRRREMRNIILKLRLEPNYAITSVRALRNHLYSFFETKMDVSLRFFMLDGLTVDISGVVESCEAPPFSEEPGMQVSILCPDPDFLALDPVVVSGEETVSTLDEFVITYEGTVPTGILFQLNLNRSESDFTIYQRPPDNVLRQLDFAASLVNLDVLKINTVPGNKYITLTRSGSDTSLLYGMSPTSKWITLMPGDNNFRVYATGAAIPFTITYTPRYGGL